MTNSVLIGKAIYKILTDDIKVKQLLNNKIYPLVAAEGTSYPFAVYSKESIQPQYTKDGNCLDIVQFSIAICDPDYSKSLDITNAVRNALEYKKGIIAGVAFNRIVIDNISEEYIENTFVQTINFTIEIV